MLQKYIKLYQQLVLKEQLDERLSLEEKSFLQLCKKSMLDNKDTVSQNELERLCSAVMKKLT